MGLTVAEAELARLDQERVRDRVTLERERSYAENIISKIDDILWVAHSVDFPVWRWHAVMKNCKRRSFNDVFEMYFFLVEMITELKKKKKS